MNKIPKLPEKLNQILLFVAPIYAGFFGIVGFLGLITFLALVIKSGASISEILKTFNEKTGDSMISFGVFLAIFAGTIFFFSVKKLIKRQLLGWKLLLTGEIILFIGSVLTFGSSFSILSFVKQLIVFYLILQLKGYYK